MDEADPRPAPLGSREAGAPPAERPAVELALARAGAYAALAAAFAPPGPALARAAGLDAAEGLALLLADLGIDADALGPTAALIAPAPEALAPRYVALFGHTARGEVPPYETEYGVSEGLFRQTEELADIQGFLGAFGLALAPGAHERADHVRCECELLAFLAAKEAYALEQGDRVMQEATAGAARLFLRDHLGRFAAAFAGRLERADAGGFYAAWGRLLGAVVAADAARLEVELGESALGLRSLEDDAVPMACGSDAGASALASGAEGGCGGCALLDLGATLGAPRAGLAGGRP